PVGAQRDFDGRGNAVFAARELQRTVALREAVLDRRGVVVLAVADRPEVFDVAHESGNESAWRLRLPHFTAETSKLKRGSSPLRFRSGWRQLRWIFCQLKTRQISALHKFVTVPGPSS